TNRRGTTTAADNTAVAPALDGSRDARPGTSDAMVTTHDTSLWTRVLDREPVGSLDDWIAAGGGGGLTAALRLGEAATLDELEASGLRGRGGAGFPTAAKWRTVLAYEPEVRAPSVVVNAAEGEPGSFKDRAILQANPYRVLEGALIAANTVGAG